MRELDRPGHIIGVNTDDSVGVWLQERLTAARLRANGFLTDSVARSRIEGLSVAPVDTPNR